MDFELTDEQKLLRDTTRELLGRSYDAEKRNAVTDTEQGWSPQVWKQLAEVGLLGLSFDEEDGGMGAGPVEVASVMTEIGRRLAPEPVLDAVLVPGGLIAAAGSTEQRRRILPDVSEGNLLLAFADREPGVRWPSTQVSTTAKKDGDAWTLTGTKNPVPHGGSANTLVVTAALPDGGVGLFLVDAGASGLTRTAYATHDGLRAAQVELSDTPAEPSVRAATRRRRSRARRSGHRRHCARRPSARWRRRCG